MKRTKTIVVIPARGGSKRLPHKNVKVLGDIPLLAHSILYAQRHPHIIDAIYVSTDDAQIKKIAKSYGAGVVERPGSISGDHATSVSAIKHVLESIVERVNNVILLQPTNPLRPENLLNKAFDKFLKEDFDNLMTVSKNSHKLGRIKENKFVPFNYHTGQRSQDLEPLYYENGLLYISKVNAIVENRFLDVDTFPFIVEHPYANVDIDTQDDFNYAEFLLWKDNN
ncbi:MAG: CMP-N-acetylneuraminic acid synthetase [Patiriisocius sp.]|jgi:CMP-N-acetylneuraminic acid synthetase